MPPALREKAAGQIVFVQPLHDQHNLTRHRIVKSGAQRGSIVSPDGLPRGFGVGFGGIVGVIHDDEVGAQARD